jgi:regulator of protease activity HflC (stomatin/prohibitin superfamily)
MQTPRPVNDPANTVIVLVAIALSALLLVGQALFIVPAGKVAVVTTLGKVSGGSRLPGLNLKIPLIQSVNPFDVRTQVRPEEFSTLTKDLQVIEATATVKYAVRSEEAGRIYRTIASNDRDIYPRIIQPSLLKALKSVFSQYELITIATEWNDISAIVERTVAEELNKFDYVEVRSLDLTWTTNRQRISCSDRTEADCRTAASSRSNRGEDRRARGDPLRHTQSQPG